MRPTVARETGNGKQLSLATPQSNYHGTMGNAQAVCSNRRSQCAVRLPKIPILQKAPRLFDMNIGGRKGLENYQIAKGDICLLIIRPVSICDQTFISSLLKKKKNHSNPATR